MAPAERRRGRRAVDAGRAGLRAGLVPDLGLGGRAGPRRRGARGPAVARLGRPRPGRPSLTSWPTPRSRPPAPTARTSSPCWWRSIPMRSPTAPAARSPTARWSTVLTGLATEARGRLRALVADVSGDETSTVGVVAWTLVADGWRALRAHHDDDGLRLEVARVIPEDLAAELAPVLAEVSRVSVRVAERSDKYDQLLQLADVFDRSGDELRAMSGLGRRGAARRRRRRLRRPLRGLPRARRGGHPGGDHRQARSAVSLDRARRRRARRTGDGAHLPVDRRAPRRGLRVHGSDRRARDRLPRSQRRARRCHRHRRPDRDRRARPRRRGGVPQRARRGQPRAPGPGGVRWRRAARRPPDAGRADGRVPLGRIRPSGRARRAARRGCRPHAPGLLGRAARRRRLAPVRPADRAWTSRPTSRRRASRRR